MCPLRGGGESCGPNRQHIVIAEACPFNTGEALINLRREPEISTSGTGWERLTLIPTLVCFSFGGGISAKRRAWRRAKLADPLERKLCAPARPELLGISPWFNVREAGLRSCSMGN
jgi:hypothetical protein